jgi:hypothetical protein
MVDLEHHDKNGFLLQGPERGVAQLVGVPGKRREVLVESKRRFRIDQIHPIADRQSELRQVAAGQAAYCC